MAAGGRASRAGLLVGVAFGSLQWLAHGDLPIGWPGATAAASNESWGGHQPYRLEYWPKEADGSPAPCWKITVLRDVNSPTDPWADMCSGLMYTDENGLAVNQTATSSSSAEACKQECEAEAQCPTWQYNDQGVNLGCWVGYGMHCRSAQPGEVPPAAGQRIIHGDIKVLGEMTHFLINGLATVTFDTNCAETECIERCRGLCTSEIGCQYWQYTTSGCKVDAVYWTQGQVQYPLTTEGVDMSAAAVATILAGEFIVHECPQQVVEDTGAAAADEDEGGIPAWVWALLALCLCCCVVAGLMKEFGGIAYVKDKMRSLRGRGKRTGRGLKQPSTSTDVYESQPLVHGDANKDLFDRMDTNHDGVLTKDEFVKLYQQREQHPQPQQAVSLPAYQLSPPSLLTTPQPYTTTQTPSFVAGAQAPTQLLTAPTYQQPYSQTLPTQVAATAALPTYQAMPAYR